MSKVYAGLLVVVAEMPKLRRFPSYALLIASMSAARIMRAYMRGCG
jgi:hypothetical protein